MISAFKFTCQLRLASQPTEKSDSSPICYRRKQKEAVLPAVPFLLSNPVPSLVPPENWLSPVFTVALIPVYSYEKEFSPSASTASSSANQSIHPVYAQPSVTSIANALAVALVQIHYLVVIGKRRQK